MESSLYSESGRRVAARLIRPANWLATGLGLLIRPPLQPGEALWLQPCGSIHTWGMRYPIDALFLDADLRILRVAPAIRPWRVALAPRGTRSVIELPAGAARGLGAGDRLLIRSQGAASS